MLALLEFTKDICDGWRATQPTSILYKTLTVCFVIANTATSLCGTIANVLIIASYCRYRSVRALQNTFFALLAITDLAITAFSQPLYILAMLQSAFFIYDCTLWFVIYLTTTLCLGLSLVTVMALSLHSFVTLAYPYHYHQLVPYLKGLVIFLWSTVFIFLTFLTCFASKQIFTTTGACLIVLTIVTVTTTWAWTYKLIRRHRRRIATSQTPTNSTGDLTAQKKVLRSTMTACMVVGGLIICYVPGFVRLIYEANVSGSDWIFVENVLRPLASTLMYGNSLLNPCLVLWRSTEIRQAANRVLC